MTFPIFFSSPVWLVESLSLASRRQSVVIVKCTSVFEKQWCIFKNDKWIRLMEHENAILQNVCAAMNVGQAQARPPHTTHSTRFDSRSHILNSQLTHTMHMWRGDKLSHEKLTNLLTLFPEYCAQVVRILLQFTCQRDFTAWLNEYFCWSSYPCFQLCMENEKKSEEASENGNECSTIFYSNNVEFHLKLCCILHT